MSCSFFFGISSSWNVLEVKSYYKMLQSTAHSSFPWRILWKSKIPTKVSFFFFFLFFSFFFPLDSSFGKIPTANNVKKRGIIIIDRHCLSKRDRETTVGHLARERLGLLKNVQIQSLTWSFYYSKLCLSG